MAMAGLPEDGPVELGSGKLPPGRRIIPEDAEPVAWVTDDVVPGPGRAWSALRDLHASTCLVPVLLDPLDSSRDFPFFFGGVDPGEIDRVDPAQILAERWPRDDQRAVTALKRGEGLAPAEDIRLPEAQLQAALDSLRPAHIGLVPARRPADVLAALGWVAFDDLADHPNGVWIGSVLRSWEDRFGAILLKIGPGARIRLLVERPPHTLDAALKIAAEHKAFADEHADPQAAMPGSVLAPILMDAPIWSFWWD
jgi:Domain of unknown function (DUF4253)